MNEPEVNSFFNNSGIKLPYFFRICCWAPLHMSQTIITLSATPVQVDWLAILQTLHPSVADSENIADIADN